MKNYQHYVRYLFLTLGLFLVSLSHWDNQSVSATEESYDPQDIQEIVVELSLGDVNITVEDVEEIIVELPEIGNSIRNYEVTSNRDGNRLIILGESEGFNWNFGSIDFNLDPVQITIPDSTELESIDLVLSLGSAKLIQVNSGLLTAELSMGDFLIEDGEYDEAHIELSMGNLDINQTILGESKLEIAAGDLSGSVKLLGQNQIMNSMGNVTLDLLQSLNSTTVRSDVSLGSFETGMISNISDYPRWENTSHESIVDVEVSMGNIELNFLFE